jgi:transposase
VTDDIKRFTIICHLASGASNKEAADQTGVSLSTVERLKRDVDFKAELTDAISQIYRSSLLKLTLGMSKAASELLRIIESTDTPDRVKLKAIEILFSQTLNLDQLVLEDKMNRIEELLKTRTIQQLDEDDEGNWYPTKTSALS